MSKRKTLTEVILQFGGYPLDITSPSFFYPWNTHINWDKRYTRSGRYTIVEQSMGYGFFLIDTYRPVNIAVADFNNTNYSNDVNFKRINKLRIWLNSHRGAEIIYKERGADMKETKKPTPKLKPVRGFDLKDEMAEVEAAAERSWRAEHDEDFYEPSSDD